VLVLDFLGVALCQAPTSDIETIKRGLGKTE
jgi:hypothetical protein